MKTKDLVLLQKNYFETGETKSIKFRIEMLNKLHSCIKNNEEAIYQALKKDLNKSLFEALATEINFVLSEITKVKKWFSKNAKKVIFEKRKNSITTIFSKSLIINEPYGTSLIIGPWNYPFQLLFSPLIGSIVSGGTAVLKPSEMTPATSKVIAKIIKETFEEKYIAVVEGAVKETTELLQQPFDFVFFTGSPMVGKIIMKACAEQLIPNVLELGGKSPIIFDKSVNDKNMELYARRIAFGKFVNSGQTCIAPDYILVHESKEESLIKNITEQLEKIFDKDAFSTIINTNHVTRLKGYLKDGEIVYGGNVKGKAFEPTLMKVTDISKPIMKEEIFGPILPIVTYKELDEVYPIIKQNADPLAAYVFSDDSKLADSIISKIQFGGGCINDCIKHITNKHLPFGGKGQSGIGRYGGTNSFYTFTYQKGIVKKSKMDIAGAYQSHPKSIKTVRKYFK